MVKKIETREVHLRYYGHSSFGLTTPNGIEIIIDPYHNTFFHRWFREPFPSVRGNIVIVTHDHFDHNGVTEIQGNPQIIRSEGVYEEEFYTVRMLKGRHARGLRYGHFRNLIAIVDIHGLRFVHWGDNRMMSSKELMDKFMYVDVLMVPVDDNDHLLDFSEVDSLITGIQPRVVIPMHYRDEEIHSEKCPLGGIDKWLKGRKYVRRINSEGAKLNQGKLTLRTKVWVFDRYQGAENERT